MHGIRSNNFQHRIVIYSSSLDSKPQAAIPLQESSPSASPSRPSPSASPSLPAVPSLFPLPSPLVYPPYLPSPHLQPPTPYFPVWAYPTCLASKPTGHLPSAPKPSAGSAAVCQVAALESKVAPRGCTAAIDAMRVIFRYLRTQLWDHGLLADGAVRRV